jgi:RHS repeat-associated protein
VGGAATDAKYTITSASGSTTRTVNQATGTGTWVSLGSYAFTQAAAQKVSISDQATGTVVADAIKLVRDNTGDTDTEKHDYSYFYDPNENLTSISDASPGAQVDTYNIGYTGLNQIQSIVEQLNSTTKNTTSYTYDENGATATMTHDQEYQAYEYDARNLLSKITTGKSASDPAKKTTTYTYTDRGDRLHEVKGNGNTVDYTYFLDGSMKTQTEKKSNGTLVSDHAIDYDLNGNRTQDVAKMMNADNHSAYLNATTTYTYDPRDRLIGDSTTGDGASSESYVYDANDNVTSQTVKGVPSTFIYDRNRLLSSVTAGVTSAYNYDPFGRLDTTVSGDQVVDRNIYDGFDHIIENRTLVGASTVTTKYTFDPMNRTSTKTTDAGTAKAKITTFNYIGLSSQVLDEEVGGQIQKSFQYSPWGERISQVKVNSDGSQEPSYYGYNQHTDVETLTGDTGDTRATYGYSAYGEDNNGLFTGIDKPDPQDPTKEPYNAYRFNSMRWDQSSGTYDMGFRDYDPGLNRFLTRDMYNGALADLSLSVDPWTGNRYAFGGGNPISAVELDGHCWSWAQGICDAASSAGDFLSRNSSQIAETAAGIGLMILGDMAFDAGAALTLGGAAICLTGVGCIAGGPAAALGVGLMGVGVLAMGSGALLTIDGITKMDFGSSSSGGGGSSAGSSSGGGGRPPLRTPQEGSTDGGPGQWVRVNRGPNGADYQETATGVTRGSEYEVNGTKFDGFDNGKLIDAKDNYKSFLDKNGEWQDWFRKAKTSNGKSGYDSLMDEARTQERISQETGTPLEWRVSSPEVQQAIQRSFYEEGINIPVVVYP